MASNINENPFNAPSISSVNASEPIRILIAEDDLMVGAMAKRLVEIAVQKIFESQQKIEVVVATKGSEFMERLTLTKPWHAIFLDINLPVGLIRSEEKKTKEQEAEEKNKQVEPPKKTLTAEEQRKEEILQRQLDLPTGLKLVRIARRCCGPNFPIFSHSADIPEDALERALFTKILKKPIALLDYQNALSILKSE